MESRGRPNFAASQPSVCRSISFAAGEVRQLANCGVVHGDQRVGDHGGKRHAGIEQAEVARMRHLHLPGSQHLFYIGDHFLERQRSD